jgi:Amt family ammonium transporter
MLEGTLTVRSTPGEGSQFTLTLPTGPLEGVPLLTSPAEAVASVDRGDPPVANPAENTVLAGHRILLAEDGLDNQRLISHFLRKAGAVVEIVDNGQLAVEAALRNEAGGQPFDTILMDVQMPVLDGHCATRQLRERGYHRPIIAVTAHAMNEDRLQCLAAGCNEFVTKPVNRRTLVGAIVQVLADFGMLGTLPQSRNLAKNLKVPSEGQDAVDAPRFRAT